MADMLGDDDKCRWQDDADGIEVEDRRVERRQGKPGGFFDETPVYETADGCEDIAADNAQENRDDSEEAADGYRGKYRDGKRGKRDENRRTVSRFIARETGHRSSRRHELKADDGDDGAHCGRREDDINPFGANGADNQADKAEDDTDGDKTAKGSFIAVLAEYQEHRREERKARTEIGRDAAFAEQQI